MSLLGYLAERERIEQGATKGPWYVVGPPWNNGPTLVNSGSDDPHSGKLVCDLACQTDEDLGSATPNDVTDAAFIANARTAVPTLIAMVREATEALRSVGVRSNSVADYNLAHHALARLDAMATEDAT